MQIETRGIFILQYKIFDHVYMSNMKELFKIRFLFTYQGSSEKCMYELDKVNKIHFEACYLH